MPTIRGLGTTVEVEIGDAIGPDEFAAAWARCLVAPDPDASDVDAPDVVVGPSRTMSGLTQAITHALIGRRRGELLMLHAGAVCSTRTGDSVAFVAPGGTGKTTLSRLLGRRYGYLTDETVGLDPVDRLIHPYPKPLSLRTTDGRLPKSERGPDELGLQPAHSNPRLTSLVFLHREPALATPRWTRLELFDAITTLAPETSSLARLERPLHLLADLYAALDGFWLVEYAEAEAIVHWMDERLGEP